MMFARSNTYEFLIEGRSRWEPRVYLKAECSSTYSGDGNIRFWGERHEPWSNEEIQSFLIAKKGKPPRFPSWIDTTEKITIVDGAYVNSYLLVAKESKTGTTYSKRAEDWLLSSLVKALCSGEVTGRAASEMMWDVFWRTQVKKNSDWIKNLSATYWELIDPDRERVTT